jgi:hypothetical protein
MKAASATEGRKSRKTIGNQQQIFQEKINNEVWKGCRLLSGGRKTILRYSR